MRHLCRSAVMSDGEDRPGAVERRLAWKGCTMSIQSLVADHLAGPRPPATAIPAGKDLMPTVLIVDDEAIVREVVAEYLKKDGFRVESAADGHEALARFATARPDLVLL